MAIKTKIYVDTSVIGGIFDSEFDTWSKILFQEFKNGRKIVILSDLTLREIEDAPHHVRTILEEIPDKHKQFVVLNDEAKELASHYLKEGAIAKKYLIDAQHIAIATVYRVDVLVSWNFKHIVNLEKIRFYNSINLKYGYPTIEIRSPREVLHEEKGV